MRNCPLIFPFLVPSTTLPVAAVAILLAVVVEVRRVRASGGELPAAVAVVLYRAEVSDDVGDGLVGVPDVGDVPVARHKRPAVSP